MKRESLFNLLSCWVSILHSKKAVTHLDFWMLVSNGDEVV